MIYWEKTKTQGPKGYYRCSCFRCISQRLREFNDVNTRILLEGFLINLDSNDFESKL